VALRDRGTWTTVQNIKLDAFEAATTEFGERFDEKADLRDLGRAQRAEAAAEGTKLALKRREMHIDLMREVQEGVTTSMQSATTTPQEQKTKPTRWAALMGHIKGAPMPSVDDKEIEL